MDYRDNRQRWAESHQVVHFYAGQWCTFTPALTHILFAEDLFADTQSIFDQLCDLVSHPRATYVGGSVVNRSLSALSCKILIESRKILALLLHEDHFDTVRNRGQRRFAPEQTSLKAREWSSIVDTRNPIIIMEGFAAKLPED